MDSSGGAGNGPVTNESRLKLERKPSTGEFSMVAMGNKVILFLVLTLSSSTDKSEGPCIDGALGSQKEPNENPMERRCILKDSNCTSHPSSPGKLHES